MAERDARTVGAQKAAETAQAAAAEKVKQYQEALKQARGQLYAEQEAARKKTPEERAAQIKNARTKAAGEVSAAKVRIAAELAAARRDLEATVAQLSAEIARRVLQTPPRPGAPARRSSMTRNRRVFFAAGILFAFLFAAVSMHAAEEKSGNAAASARQKSSSGSTLPSLRP